MSLPPNLAVNSTYINWILTSNRGIMGHLYQFTSATGTNDYFTDLDLDISYNSQTWKSSALRFEGFGRKLAVGLAVDEQSVKVWAAPTDTLFGANFLSGVEEGLLDGAIIVRYRVIWPMVTGNVANDVALTPIAVWPLFTGYTSIIGKGGSSHIEMKVKSALVKLNVNMPRNYYQPGCLWTLFSAGCALTKSHYTVASNIGAGPTLTTIPISGGVPTPTGADGLPNYQQGRLLFTSGVNNGLQVLIDNNDSTNLYLAYPLNALPSAGDNLNYWPGCSKTYATCTSKWANEANWRGFDKVPPIMVSM